MSLDFRADQLRTRALISSGSQLLVYPIAADGTPPNQGNINQTKFNTSSIGTDVYLFVSGATNSSGQSNTKGTTAFGGDVVVSGTFTALGNPATVRTPAYISLSDFIVTTVTESNPQVVCQAFVDANEIPHSNVYLRAVLSSLGGGSAFVKLYNLTTDVYVDLAAGGVKTLSTPMLNPTHKQSFNLSGAFGFTLGQAIYELQLYTNPIGTTALLGKAQFVIGDL